jgi:hypothetical protein
LTKGAKTGITVEIRIKENLTVKQSALEAPKGKQLLLG